MQVRAQSAPWHAGVVFLARSGDSVGTSVVFEQVAPGQITQPTFILNYEDAQVLMDDLWNAGLRPTEGTGSAGALAATQRHLDDMRRLVFKEKHEKQETRKI